MTLKTKDLRSLKSRLNSIINHPLPPDKKEAKRLKSLKKVAEYYLMDIYSAELTLEKKSIYGAQVKLVFSEDNFFKELRKFDNYDFLYDGEFVNVVELYSYKNMSLTSWVMWCRNIAD